MNKNQAKKSVGIATTTLTVYRVLARNAMFNAYRVIELADGILGPEFREVHFPESNNPAGVPFKVQGWEMKELSFEAATALAWTLVAQHPLGFIECKLEAFELQISYNVTRKGEVDIPLIKEQWANVIKIKEENAEATPVVTEGSGVLDHKS